MYPNSYLLLQAVVALTSSTATNAFVQPAFQETTVKSIRMSALERIHAEMEEFASTGTISFSADVNLVLSDLFVNMM